MSKRVLCVILLLSVFLDGSFGNSCFKQASDIIFLMDSSWSIRSLDFHRQLSFLRALVDKFTIGHNNIQVGVVSFGSKEEVNIRLKDFHNSRDLKQAIGNIHHLSSGTNTYLAIHRAHSELFEPINGGRPWARRQIVLITDGLSMNSSLTLLEASIARSKGIEIFSVGVGEMSEDLEIWGVASEPKLQHVYRVENYKALHGIEKALSSAACNEHNPGNTTMPDMSNKDESEPPEALTACEKTVADIVFIMDSSSSIWQPHFEAQIKFIQEIVSSFDIGPEQTRVAVVAYSDAPLTLLELSDEQTNEHIHQVLSKAPYITGGTNTAFAFNHVRKNVLASGVARPNIPHIIIILTDGESNNIVDTIIETDLAKYEGSQVICIGIGNDVKASELMAMASDPDDKFVYHVDDFERLSEIRDLLAIKTCDVVASLQPQQDKPANCPNEPTDVVFIYDSAALSHQQHSHVIETITAITESQDLNGEQLRVGVMREPLSKTPSVLYDIELTDQWRESNFKDQLDPNSRKCNIDKLFRKVRHKYFHPGIENDKSAHRTVVVFLDSALVNPVGTLREALYFQRANVQITLVILSKQVADRDVKFLASHLKNIHVIDSSTDRVTDLSTKLLTFLCQ